MTDRIHNPLGAFGVTDLRSVAGGEPMQMKANGHIFVNDVVSIDTSGRVVQCITNGTATLVIGVAVAGPGTSSDTSAIAGTGTPVQVVTQGIAAQVKAAGAVAAGDVIKRSATTAGYVSATAAPAASECFAIAINASASNLVDIWVGKQCYTA